MLTYPLSTPLSPAFSPMSPTTTPEKGNNVLGSLIGTMKAWRPWSVPSLVISLAYTAAWVQCLPENTLFINIKFLSNLIKHFTSISLLST